MPEPLIRGEKPHDLLNQLCIKTEELVRSEIRHRSAPSERFSKTAQLRVCFQEDDLPSGRRQIVSERQAAGAGAQDDRFGVHGVLRASTVVWLA